MSPIPLGILAASGVEVAAATYELLETKDLSSTTANIEFTNLTSAYSSTYTHLQFRWSLRSSRTTTDDAVFVQLNGDTGSNYAWHYFRGPLSGTPQRSNGVSQSAMYMTEFPASGSNTYTFGAGVLEILDPFVTTKNTVLRALGGNTRSPRLFNSSGLWMNTASLNSIKFYSSTGNNFTSGSRLSLYGLRAA